MILLADKPGKAAAIAPTEIDWAQISKEWKSSKKTQELFCKSRGINYSTFVYQRSKLREKLKNKKKKEAKFSPVKITTLNRPNILSPVILHLAGGARLEIPSCIAVSQLKPLLQLLGVIAC